MSKQGKGWCSESQEDLQQCLPLCPFLMRCPEGGVENAVGGLCSRGTHALEGEGVQIQAYQGPKHLWEEALVITSACLEMPLATPAVTPYVV